MLSIKFHSAWDKNSKEEFIMKMRKGFTLVELLIVIIIIGILAAAMLLSSGSASDSAAATAALSEMRAIKAAIVMHAANAGGRLPVASVDVNLVSKDLEKPEVIVKKYAVGANDDGLAAVVLVAKQIPAGAEEKLLQNPATKKGSTTYGTVNATDRPIMEFNMVVVK